VTRAILHSFLTQFAGLAVAFVVSILTARILLPAGRADLALYNFALSLLAGSLGFGSTSSAIYFRARGEISLSRIGLISAAQCVIAVGVCLLIVRLDAGQGAAEFIPRSNDDFFAYLLIFNLPVALINQLIFSLLASEQKYYTRNYLTLVSSGMLLVSCTWLFVHSFTPERALKILLTLTALGNTLIAIIGWSIYRRSPLDCVRAGRQVSTLGYFRYGAINAGADLVQSLAYRADIWLVLYFLGKDALGQHAVAVGLAQTLWVLPQAAAAVVFPNVSRGLTRLDEVARLARLSLLVVGCGAVVAALAAPWFFPVMFGREFGSSATVFIWLMPGIVIFVASKVYAGYLGGEGLVHANLLASLAGCCIGLVVAAILIPLWGLAGAGFAASISYIVTTAVMLATVARRSGLPVRELFIVQRGDLKQLVNGALRGAASFGFGRPRALSDGEMAMKSRSN
jgi:O-antigen/teichoic acid export membrane protein